MSNPKSQAPNPNHSQSPNPKFNYQLPTTNYQLPTANCQLPTTNYQLPITNYQLATSNPNSQAAPDRPMVVESWAWLGFGACPPPLAW
jgi:hypothetical protein